MFVKAFAKPPIRNNHIPFRDILLAHRPTKDISAPDTLITASNTMSATYGINHARSRHNLFEVEGLVSDVPQGSSLLATLGFVAESLWDSCAHAGFKIS